MKINKTELGFDPTVEDCIEYILRRYGSKDFIGWIKRKRGIPYEPNDNFRNLIAVAEHRKEYEKVYNKKYFQELLEKQKMYQQKIRIAYKTQRGGERTIRPTTL